MSPIFSRAWELRPTPDDTSTELFSRYPKVVATLLWQRGVTTPELAEDFFHPSYNDHLADPFLFRQMREAVEEVTSAIRDGMKIMVHGDYDADGVTSTALLVEALRQLGGKVEWYVPNRFSEGYGLKLETVRKFARDGVQLLITVDCGSTNVDEIALAKERGMRVLVLDHHHQPAVLPPADAIINPVFEDETYPFRGHSSAGVAFTLLRAIIQTTENGKTIGHPQPDGWEKWLLDLVAISTVADMMPLRGENRVFVHYGMRVLRQTRRVGLRALLAHGGVKLQEVTERTIGFHIGPRLNAAGRLEHASTAVELLLTKDRETGDRVAADLERINNDRRRLTDAATSEAWEHIQAHGEAGAHAVFAPHWSPGVLGLVAGRLAERVGRPVFVMTENDTQVVGSGRSGSALDLMTIMNAGKEHFSQFGGHPGACGFTLQSPQQRAAFEAWLGEYMSGADAKAETPPLLLDAEVRAVDVSPEFLDAIEELAPFGIDAHRPLFMLKDVDVHSMQFVGGEQQHVRLRIRQDGKEHVCIGFRLADHVRALGQPKKIDLAVEPAWNEWNGRREIQLRLLDLRPSHAS